MANDTIAYIVSRFPHLPESFILREIDQLEAQETNVILCPLVRHREPVSQPRAQRWIGRAWYTPFLSRVLARDVVWWLGRSPARAAFAICYALWRVAFTPNFLVGTLGILPKAFHLARRFEDEGVSHIHAHFATHPAMAAWVIHQLTGIGYSFTAHAHDIYVHTAMLDRKVADARFVVAISEYNRQLLERFGGSGKVRVVHCGVDVGAYSPRPRPPLPFVIASVASLQTYKGLAYLIRACALLRARGLADFQCRIIGGGDQREALAELIAQLDLERHVTLLGPQPEERVAALLRTAHLFVLPSVVTPSGKMEGLPVAIMEALATGVPVISTNISGIPEIVRPGETGLLVPPGDPAALADAIEQVWADPAAAESAAARGRALVLEEFSLARNAETLRRLFRELLADPPAIERTGRPAGALRQPTRSGE